MTYYIYGLHNGDGVIRYVGLTQNLRVRLNEHRSTAHQDRDLKRGNNLEFVQWKKDQTRLEALTLETVVDGIDPFERETWWTLNTDNLLNKATGRSMPRGEASHSWGRKHSDEWKQAMSARLRGGGHPLYGKTLTPEERLKKGSPGGKNPNALLTQTQARRIRQEYEQGTIQRVLADRYGVTQSVISRVVRGETYREAV